MLKPLGKFFKRRIIKSVRIRLVKGTDEVVVLKYVFNPPMCIQRGYEVVIDAEEETV